MKAPLFPWNHVDPCWQCRKSHDTAEHVQQTVKTHYTSTCVDANFYI